MVWNRSPPRAEPSASPAAGAGSAPRAGGWFSSLARRVPLAPDGGARIGQRQIYILPTGTGVVYGIVLLTMLLGSLNYQNNLSLLFTFFFGAVALVAMHHTWFNLLGVVVQARGGEPTFAGGEAAFEISLREERGRPRYGLRVVGTQQTQGQALVPGDRLTIALPLPAPRRGYLDCTEITLETRYPLDLFRAWSYVRTDARTLVYPAPTPTAPLPRADGADRRRARPTVTEGTEDYLGPRAYRRGDSPRHIDWKAFARERGLVVKSFADLRGEAVWIDWQDLPGHPEEERLSLLTRQVLSASEADLRFGLRLPGASEPIGRGPEHTRRCLTHLALHGQPRPTPGAATGRRTG